MNGATEATLAELVRIAEQQNVNLERLNSLLSRGGGSGGGGGGGVGLGSLVSNIPLLGAGFDMLKGAASLVGSAFEMVGSIIGKLVSGITDTIGNLFKFSLMAMEGTAKLSDLYTAFKDLPFGLGLIAQGFSFLLKILEKAVVEFQAMANAGATFSGGMTELRIKAASVNMTLQEFSKMVQSNSDLFANFGGTVQSGVNKFTSAMAPFRPGGQFASSINSLGMTTADAAEYMLTMMKTQQGMTKNGQIDSASLSKMTKNYIQELDGLSRLTGVHRDQLNESVKKAADDQVWMTFLDSLNPNERKAKMDELAMAEATMGRDFAENVTKYQLRGIAAPMNKTAEQMAVASGGLSVSLMAATKRINESSMSDADKRKAIMAEYAKVAIGTSDFVKKLPSQLQAVYSADLPQGVLKFGRALGAVGNDVAAYQAKMAKEQQDAKDSPAGQLLAAQEKIKDFGNTLTIMMSRLAEMLLPTLIAWGNKVIDWMSGLATKYGPKLTEWINTAVALFQEYVVPKLVKIGTWISDTWDQLVAAGKKGPKEFFEVIKERFMSGVNNIWDDLKKLWNLVKPVFLEIWYKDIKPVLKKAFEDIGDYIIQILREKVWGAKMFLDPSRAEEKEELKELRKNKGKTNEIADAGRPELWNLVGIKRYNDALDEQLRLQTLELKYRNDPDVATPRGRRASGGSVSPGTYLVGERGPELASMGSDGSIITNENLQQLLARMANNQDNKNLVTLMEALNNNMKQLNGYARETAEYTRRTVGEIAGLSPNLLPQI
jgi:hypothetical protein